MITDYNIKLLISKYVGGSLSDAEVVDLAEWVKASPQNALDFRREVQAVAAKGSTTADAVRFWQRFSQRYHRLAVGRGGSMRVGRRFAGAALAAVAVVCISVAISYIIVDTKQSEPSLYSESVASLDVESVRAAADVVYTAADGERRSVQLPDSSKVILNSGATLTLKSDFNEVDRRVLLDGEAYFEVAKNPSKLFTVHCGDKSYVVRGTSFNIVSYNDDRYSVVTLHTGSLEAHIKEDVIVLSPGEELRVDGTMNQISKQVVDVSNSISWINNNQLRFAEFPLKFVANKLSHKYHVKINIHSSIENILYDGRIDDESLEDALHLVSITAPVPLVITEFDGEYYVSKRTM